LPLDNSNRKLLMKIIKIPKGNGKFRTIYALSEREKNQANSWRAFIESENIDSADVQHGFRIGRSPVTNALEHRAWRYTLSMDLKDFFDSVSPGHMPWALLKMPLFRKWCFFDGAARQGIPTSPAIANLAAQKMDDEICALNQQSRLGRMFIYTRYADDMVFSFNYAGIADMLKAEVPRIAERHMFQVNDEKTTLQCARQGRRQITGVSVDDEGVHLPRATKRKLRAIEHQLKKGIRGHGLKFHISRQRDLKRRGRAVSLHSLIQGQLRGLREWAKLKLPTGYVKQTKSGDAPLAAVLVAASGGAHHCPIPPSGIRKFSLC
jgi:hypothetical protein